MARPKKQPAAQSTEQKAPETPKQPAAQSLVKMLHPDRDYHSDVHPLEVENYRAGGWYEA